MQARRPCSSAPVKGGPQNAMIPSPIYLSMMPLLRRTGSDITVMYRFSTLTSPAGVMPSLKAVNPFMSQNKIVISRRAPLASVSSGRSSSPATMRGSTYFPKVSRICALTRNSPTMLLKDRVSEPISSREVIGTTVSSAPCSTAAVPSSRRRTGRTRPSVTAAAKVRPSSAAIASNATPIVQFAEQFAGDWFVARLRGSEQLAEDPFVTLPFVLQIFDFVIESCQRDVVVKIEGIGDLPVNVLTRIGNPFVARLAGARNFLAQLSACRGIVSGFGDRQQQPANIGRFFN